MYFIHLYDILVFKFNYKIIIVMNYQNQIYKIEEGRQIYRFVIISLLNLTYIENFRLILTNFNRFRTV